MAADAFRESRRRKSQLEVLASILESVSEALAFYSRREQAGVLTATEEVDRDAAKVRESRVKASIGETEQRISELEGVTRG